MAQFLKLNQSLMISDNLKQVKSRIDSVQSRKKVELIAVSKTRSTKEIQEAVDAGQVHFGENYLQESIEKIKQAGGVGEVAGNFFDKNGKFISIKETEKITSADIDSFKKSTTVLVAGGRHKISQIKSVLKSGLFTGLITDEETAKQL